MSFTIISKTSATLSWKPPKKYGLEEIVFLCNVDWFTALSTVFILRKLPTIRVTKTQIQTFLACWIGTWWWRGHFFQEAFFELFCCATYFLMSQKSSLLTDWYNQNTDGALISLYSHYVRKKPLHRNESSRCLKIKMSHLRVMSHF